MLPEVPEGLTEEVWHYRYVTGSENNTWLAHPTQYKDSVRFRILPRGGKTLVILINNNGDVVADAVAYCSQHDNYNKRLGRRIALGRALKKLNEINDCFDTEQR